MLLLLLPILTGEGVGHGYRRSRRGDIRHGAASPGISPCGAARADPATAWDAFTEPAPGLHGAPPLLRTGHVDRDVYGFKESANRPRVHDGWYQESTRDGRSPKDT